MLLLKKVIISKKCEISDCTKFSQLFVAEEKQLNFIVNVEKHIADLLKDLKNSEVISEIVY